jgi:hypothetical protein
MSGVFSWVAPTACIAWKRWGFWWKDLARVNVEQEWHLLGVGECDRHHLKKDQKWENIDQTVKHSNRKIFCASISGSFTDVRTFEDSSPTNSSRGVDQSNVDRVSPRRRRSVERYTTPSTVSETSQDRFPNGSKQGSVVRISRRKLLHRKNKSPRETTKWRHWRPTTCS